MNSSIGLLLTDIQSPILQFVTYIYINYFSLYFLERLIVSHGTGFPSVTTKPAQGKFYNAIKDAREQPAGSCCTTIRWPGTRRSRISARELWVIPSRPWMKVLLCNPAENASKTLSETTIADPVVTSVKNIQETIPKALEDIYYTINNFKAFIEL
jgi:hypothetical protein